MAHEQWSPSNRSLSDLTEHYFRVYFEMENGSVDCAHDGDRRRGQSVAVGRPELSAGTLSALNNEGSINPNKKPLNRVIAFLISPINCSSPMAAGNRSSLLRAVGLVR